MPRRQLALGLRKAVVRRTRGTWASSYLVAAGLLPSTADHLPPRSSGTRLRARFFFRFVFPRLVHLLLHGSYRVRAAASVRLVGARHQVFFRGLSLRQIFPPLRVALLYFVDVLIARNVVQSLALRTAFPANCTAAVRAKRPAHRGLLLQRLLQSVEVLPWSIPPDRRSGNASTYLPASLKTLSSATFVLPRYGSVHHPGLNLLASNARGVAVVRPAGVRLRPRSGSLASDVVSGHRDR